MGKSSTDNELRAPGQPGEGRLVRLLTSWLRSVPSEVQPGDEKRVDWARIVPFLFLHLGCLAVLWVGWSWIAVAVCVALYVVRMFAITAFYHRYFAHRSFRTSRAAQFCFAVLGSSAAQRGPLWWAGHHRRHHKVSDTPADVHSPSQHGLLWSHVGWLTSRANYGSQSHQVRDFARYPELRWLDEWDTVVPLVLAASLLGLGFALEAWVPSLGTTGPQMLVWGFFVSTVLLFHGTCTINSLAHRIGRRRYDTRDDSRNSFVLALLTLGEGWHNNHHHFPASARQGFYWWEVDLTYYALRVLAAVGVIWDLRAVPAQLRERRVRRAA